MNANNSSGQKRHFGRGLLFILAGLLLVVLSFNLIDLPFASLVTFRRVDDFPLYTMKYRGDYDLLPSLRLDGIPGQAFQTNQPDFDYGCTVFYAQNENGEAILGRNFDWQHKATLLLFTHPKDGYASVSTVDLGYLGFEQGISLTALRNLRNAPLWPFDGMNERGVAIGMMAVPDTPGLHDPGKPTVDSLAVIRLVLDYAGSLDEALAILQGVNIDFGSGPWLHYLVSDRDSSAVVEILSDRVNVIRSEQTWQVSTNFLLTGMSEPQSDASCNRYQIASDRLEADQGMVSWTNSMDLLKDVSQENTVWSIVYQLNSGEIQIAVGRDYDHLHTFNLAYPAQEIK